MSNTSDPETNTTPTPTPTPTPPAPPPAPPPVDVLAAKQEQADELYATLKPHAEVAGRDYMLSRIPVDLRPLLIDKLDADFPPIDPTAPRVPSDPPTENAVGQYAAMRASSQAAEGKKDEVRDELVKS